MGNIARFGQIFVAPERFGVLSKAQVDAMQRREGVPFNEEKQQSLADSYGNDIARRAAWKWDLIWDDGGMYKNGYLGQGLYVDPVRDLVIAWFGTGEDYNEKRNEMPEVARQIVRSKLFEDDLEAH